MTTLKHARNVSTRWRIVAAGAVLAGVAAASALLMEPQTLFAAVQAREIVLASWVQAHPLLGPAIFLLCAMLGTISPFPGGIPIMLAGGFLFGAVGGGVLSALGLTLSACLVCFAGRRFLAGPIEKALNRRHTGVLRALTNDAFSYLMALRLLPGMPAWLTNLFPVPLPVRLRTVLMATSLGVLPVCLVFATIGNGVALLGAEHQPLSAQMILQPRYVAPLLGLAVLALLPPLIRKVREASRR